MKHFNLLMSLVLAACGPPKADTADAGGPDAGRTRSISMTYLRSHATAAGVLVDTPDITQTVVSANCWEGNELLVRKGTWLDAGLLRIENVPVGRCLVSASLPGETDFLWVETESSVLDFTEGDLGRPDIQLADAGTRLVFQLDGLTPWASNKSMELHLSSANSGFFSSGSVALDAGSTSATIDLAWGAAIIDGTKGDEFLVSQAVALALSTASGRQVGVLQRLLKSGSAAAFTVVHGATTTVPITLTPIVPKVTVSYDWKRGTARSLAAAVHPRATRVQDRLYVLAQPYTAALGPVGTRPTIGLVQMNLAAPDGGLDENPAVGLEFPNPFPPSWTVLGLVEHVFAIDYVIDNKPVTERFRIRYEDALQQFVKSPLTVPLSPPQGLKLDGQSIVQGMSPGLAPVLSWAASAIGTPTHYIVFVSEFVDDAVPHFKQTSLLYTTGTSLRLPQRLFSPGKTYLLAVSARHLAGIQIETAPLKAGFPAAFATTVSEPIRF